MTRRERRLTWVALAVLTAGAVVAAASAAFGHGGVTPNRDAAANGAVSGEFKLKTKGDSVVYSSRATIEPDKHADWHRHPGPHIVIVKGSTLRMYSQNCDSYVDYPASSAFVIDEPEFVHAVRNIGTTTLEIIVTDIREGGLRPTVVLEPQPSHECLEGPLSPASLPVTGG